MSGLDEISACSRKRDSTINFLLLRDTGKAISINLCETDGDLTAFETNSFYGGLLDKSENMVTLEGKNAFESNDYGFTSNTLPAPLPPTSGK